MAQYCTYGKTTYISIKVYGLLYIAAEWSVIMKQELMHIDLNGVNSYLLKSEDGFILVDTGGHLTLDKKFTNRRDKLQQELEKAGVKPGNLKLIILTHGHNDHVANAAYLKELYQTKIAMHAGDVELVQKLDMEKMMRSFHYQSFALNLILKIMKKQIIKINQKCIDEFTEFKPDILLKDGDDLSEYGFDAKIIHIPGHTEGSIGILVDGDKLICSDNFANIKKPSKAPNADDFNRLEECNKKIMSLKLTKLYPGHGKPFVATEIA